MLAVPLFFEVLVYSHDLSKHNAHEQNQHTNSTNNILCKLKTYFPNSVFLILFGIFRSTEANVCICMAIARKNSLFIREFYKHAENAISQYKKAQAALFTTELGKFVRETKVLGIIVFV